VGENEAALREQGGGVGREAAASLPRTQYSTGTGPVHGQLHGDVWCKCVAGSRHMLRVPRPAWAVDAADLDAAERMGAMVLELRDTESGTVYRAALRTLRERGHCFDRGFGAQIALGLPHWRQHRAPAHGEPLQLGLWRGAP